MSRFLLRLALSFLVFVGLTMGAWSQTPSQPAPGLTVTPFKASGIYSLGEKVGWKIALVPGTAASAGATCKYTVRENNFSVIKSGELDLASGPATIETTLDEPGMLYVEINGPAAGQQRALGAAVAPEKLQPVVPRPADFDTFWATKIKMLHAIPIDPVVTPGESGRDGVEYSTLRLNNIAGAHIYGQLARPARAGKFPAVLVLQWASPPYPLQKPWVVDRAATGWLALNIEPHDVPGDMPPAFYAALPQLIKSYQMIGNTDRDRSYFLAMYLGAYRAVDYLASRPDWDGHIMLVTGISMGGQQSFAVAGLHPQVTHMIVHVPAGADVNGTLHGRAVGYPNWDNSDPRVRETARYFDTVNFAPHIKATCLVAMGFIDLLAPPVGIWTAFNQIPGPKEVVPLADAPHNNLATAEQQMPYTTRSTEWLAALASGGEPKIPKAK